MIVYYKEIFGEQCRRVGLTIKDINLDEPSWYDKHSWSSKDEKSFQDWLVRYFKKNKGAFWFFRDINVFPHNRTQCKLLADKLVKQYGWKVR